MFTFRKIAKVSLILVYLVIVAGAVVRMTGSGMGCPDWPKCFGHYIPPTDISELEWHPNISIKKGQVIIVDETLQVARASFKTSTTYNPTNWEQYTKHDYAIFNPTHTWIEYINRLFGALAGLATFVLALYSSKFWKTHKKITVLSWLVVFAMGFQGWLGATVVYSVLEPVKITIHMVMALIIVAMVLHLIFISKGTKSPFIYDPTLGKWVIFALCLTLVQIILGTQVRQFIDEQIDLLGPGTNDLWLHNPDLMFYLHRSVSIVVVGLNLFLGYRIYSLKLGFTKINWVLLLIVAEIITGMVMFYADFPFSSQSLHLVMASLLFGVQYYLVLEVVYAKTSHKTL
ncbi:COX15/CtaA family protein [uncultured Kriegella sp.]|uniref:COX15/CtaA family protein n=1 Tax=uncultured Kriegella sp. TaxID=1798910 RepID=UPI0030D99971|tara:strand:- start:144758 stop:145789 length:1032 start_codon:yes stop_codon:yes gene_type:complete